MRLHRTNAAGMERILVSSEAIRQKGRLAGYIECDISRVQIGASPVDLTLHCTVSVIVQKDTPLSHLLSLEVYDTTEHQGGSLVGHTRVLMQHMVHADCT